MGNAWNVSSAGTAVASVSVPGLIRRPRRAPPGSRPGSGPEVGFYFASRRRPTLVTDGGPVITPQEYIALLAGAVEMVLPAARDSDTSRVGITDARLTPDLRETLSQQLQRQPSDPRAHRRLGIAHLQAGNCREAARHLQVAVNLLLAQTTSTECVYRTFCARLELALLLPVVIPLCLQRGRRDTAETLVSRILVSW